LIDTSHYPLGKAIPLIKEKYEAALTDICKQQGWQNALCFFEFYGPNSFAGQHLDTEQQAVILFDVNPLRKGILEPHDFIALFWELDIPTVLFDGYLTPDLVEQIRNSQLPGQTPEGVVCKGKHEPGKKTPAMFKIKTAAWLQRLKELCKDNNSLFERLM
jgi:hypothetical protein